MKQELFEICLAWNSRTETSAAVIWERPEGYKDIEKYEVYLDGILHGTAESYDYTFENLESGREYRVIVKACASIACSNELIIKAAGTASINNILDYGAIGDGKTRNTKAIQAAIDACEENGKVYVPKGTFVTGALFLKSNMTLYLEEGSRLLGSECLSEYPLMEYRWEGKESTCYASLINTREFGEKNKLQNICIEGKGTIDASGSVLREQELTENLGKPGRAVCLRNVDGVYLKGITIRQSPAWCLHLIYCSNITLNQVHIFTRWDEQGVYYKGIANGDGFDPDSCKNVLVFHSEIASQDDCIAIKSGRDEEGRRVGVSSENIRIFNCIFRSGFGVAVGSEMSGGVRNVLVEDCRFENTFSIGSIKAPRGRGGVIDHITYRNCSLVNHSEEHHDCKWFRGGIYVDNFYSQDDFDVKESLPFDESTPEIRNIIFEDLTVDTYGGNAIWLAGLKESPIKNVTLQNIEARGRDSMKVYNVESIKMDHIQVSKI